MKARLKIYQKRIFKNSLILEMKLWEVVKTDKYPDGIRYSLLFMDPIRRKKVLMDNHTPKGHHYHLDDKEFDYQYLNIDKLIDDFRLLVESHFGVNL